MEVKILKDVLKTNDEIAKNNRKTFHSRGIFTMNLMSSPGSGKTTLLEKTLEMLPSSMRPAVIEGDIRTNLDGDRIVKYSVPVVQIHTELYGGACHLDANMVQKAWHALQEEDINLLFIENVGNLICPGGYRLGEDRNVVLVSTAEGEDKPSKYPVMFSSADLIVVNKIDLLPHLDFDMELLKNRIRQLNGDAEILEISARTGENMDRWIRWIDETSRSKTPSLADGREISPHR